MKKLLYSVFAAALIIGCAKEDGGVISPEQDSGKITFSATEVLARGVEEKSAWVVGDSVLIYQAVDQADITVASGIYKITDAQGTLEYVSGNEFAYYEDADVVDFCAVYPYIDGMSVESAGVCLGADALAYDVLYARATQNAECVEFTFSHLCAKIELDLTSTALFTMDSDTVTFKNAFIGINAIGSGAETYVTGDITVVADFTDSYKASTSVFVFVDSASPYTPDVEVVLLDGTKYYDPLGIAFSEPVSESGERYKYTLSL